MSVLSSASVKRPRLVAVGPGATEACNAATFAGILPSSPYVQQRYKLINLDTTNGPRGAGVASRFALIYIAHVLRQAIQFVRIVVQH